MVGLTLALNNALSGLNVNQNALAVLSQNISNANTPGYSKQIANQQSLYLDGNGQGVNIKDITRKVDDYLIGAVQKQNSIASQADTVSNYNDRIQLLLGQPGSQTNISSYTDSFFNAIQSLSQTPDNPTLQQSVVEASKTLATGFSTLASGLQDLQLQADKDIKTAVDNINVSLANIAEFNAAITNAKSLGKSVADLEDKRDQEVKNISQYIDIQTTTRDSGALSISTTSGVTILDTNKYRLSYNAQSTSAAFANNVPLSSLDVARLDSQGNVIGDPVHLITSGTSDKVVTSVNSGQIRGLINIRDQQIPAILNQLDTLASTLRDGVNAIQNAGSGIPPASSYTGTRAVGAQETSKWDGKVRIAVLDATGQPVSAPYITQSGGGLAPLTLDLSTLNSGYGNGKPTVQTIINEINQYYGIPQKKVQLGNLDNIRLASNTKTLPGNPPSFNFDFDLSNRSASGSNFYVTNVSVLDDANASVAGVSSTIPSVALASTGTYVTTAGSGKVVVHTAAAHNFTEGEQIYLSQPAASVDGIPAGSLGGFFTISNVTSTSFEISTAGIATMGQSNDVSSMTALPPYSTIAAGEDRRTTGNGTFTADLTGTSSSQYYTVLADVAVDDGNGHISTSQVTYRINSLRTNALNDRIAATSATGAAVVLSPTSSQAIATAMLVDKDGNELARVNGAYTTTQKGYLAIRANLSGQTIVIDSLDSQQQGFYNGGVTAAGTDRGFSHYFELNNFFKSNLSSETGDTLAGSALNMAVTDTIANTPNLIATGKLTRVSQSGSNTPKYVYERNAGDNSVIGGIAALGSTAIHFDAAKGLATTNETFSAYAGSIIGVVAQQSSNATATKKTAQTLLDGFSQRSSAISGVNLDNELANTVIYQNAYSASARIITVTNSLFDALLQAAQ